MRANITKAAIILCAVLAPWRVAGEEKTEAASLRGNLPERWNYTPEIVQTMPDDDDWWKSFNDPLLDSLITTGIANNYNVEMAIRRIKIAENNVRQADSQYYPTLSASAGYTRSRNAGAIAGRNVSSTTTDYLSAGIDMNWEIDLFGKITSRVKDQKALKNVSKAEYTGVMVSLAASIASNYINLRTFQEELKVTQDYMVSQAQVVKIAKARFEAGLVSKLDVTQAETVYYSTEATLPQLQTSITQAINSIAVLLGCYPDEIRPALLQYKVQPDYHQIVPSGVPANLLRRRPDILQAEYQLAAYAAELGVSKKEFLPTLNLTGSIGVAARNAGDLFKENSLQYSIAPTLSWTIFDGLSRKYAVSSAREQMEIGIDNYNQTVLTAVEEVDNAMTRYSSSLKTIDSYKEVLKQSSESFDLSVDLYKQGLTPFTNVVDAQINTLTYSNSLITARGDALNALINLYKALGGSPTAL